MTLWQRARALTKNMWRTMGLLGFVVAFVAAFLVLLTILGNEVSKESTVDQGEATALRAKGTDDVVATNDVASFATLLSLPSMPLHVLDAVDSLSYETVDGATHGLITFVTIACCVRMCSSACVRTCVCGTACQNQTVPMPTVVHVAHSCHRRCDCRLQHDKPTGARQPDGTSTDIHNRAW